MSNKPYDAVSYVADAVIAIMLTGSILLNVFQGFAAWSVTENAIAAGAAHYHPTTGALVYGCATPEVR